ncbi:MAG: SH3 domain-containing protein [Clostridia bacterium]|nr:SH3 domain-containing protein [Clostridia bacterium]
MKKTLALLLALIMMLSMTMVSCNNEEEPDETDDDFEFNFDDPTGDATGDSTGDPTDENGENNNNGDFVAASGTSYILHPVKVRKEAKKSSSTIGVAAWGSAVQLVERSTLWTKIKFTDKDSGATLEGYVRNELLTADKKQVTLVELEAPVAAKINGLGTHKDDGTPYTLNVRTTPWNCSQSEEYPNVNVLANIGNEKYDVVDGDEVEKLGETEDGKWVYIRFTKEVDGAEKVEYGWCSAEFVKVEGEETPDTPVDTPDAPPAIDPV